jgi:predicted adenylyl cyclase CyaB
MPLEYEYSFYNFNKKDIITKIKKLGFKCKGSFLFKVQVFYHPIEKDKNKHYIRVRDEGHRITFTHKFTSEGNFEDETEVNIDNFDSAVKLLENIGCTKKYYYEKIREIWYYKDTEVVFDTNPGNIERMEVEAKSKKELNLILKELELSSKMHDATDKYLDLFGIVIPKSIDLKFNSVKKYLLPLVTKNKKEFIELLNEQAKRYKKLFKK